MKWIGQNIWDQISRFRNDVYLESVSETAQDHVVGIDANGKLYKQDVSTGDITGVTITTDSGGGSAASDTSGSADFSILGTSGIGVTNSGTTITATSVPGEIDHDSLLNFVANEHLRWDNDVSSTATIHASNIPTLNQDTTGSSASCTGQAATVATIAGLAPNTATTQATQPNIESIGTDGDSLNILSDNLLMTNSTSQKPKIELTNNTDDANGAQLEFLSNRGAAGQDNDYLGKIFLKGYNDAGTPEQIMYAAITSQIHDATDGEESGILNFQVANHDGGVGTGLKLTGGSADNTIDATIGLGTASSTTVAGDLAVIGHVTGNQYRIVNCNFRADIGTTKYYLPLKSQDEQTVLTREEMQEVAVCDGRLVSVTYRGEAFNTHSGDATVTFGVETNTVGTSYSSGYSVQETEAVTINNADDQHIFHAVFDNAKHWDSTDMFAISIQSDTDITGSNERIFLTLVIEDDWSTYLAGSTREIDSTP